MSGSPVSPSLADGLVLAHGIGGRQDLPIPFSYALTGAAVAIVVSFAALGFLWKQPRLRGDEAGRPVPGLERFADAPATRVALRVLGLMLTGYWLVGLVLGPDLATNPSAGVVYVLFWVGLVPASLLFGPVWRLLNPLRTLHAGLTALLRVDRRNGVLELSPRVGYWPAAVGLFAFVWLELVEPDRATLPVLRTWFGLYAGLHLLLALVFGSRWFDRGDAFEVYSAFIGRLAVVGRRADGRLVMRSPLDGMAGLAPAPGIVAMVAVMLGSTGFDSLSNAPVWFRFVQSGPLPAELAGSLGLVATIVVVGLLLTAASMAAGSLGHAGRRGLPGQFAHTIVPIAVGYVVAHYYSLFVLEGQRTVIELSDPRVTGTDNWLGTAERGVSGALVPATAVAVLQVVAVVLGHVVGTVLAHDRAVRLFPRAEAVRGQIPLLVLMVTYTVGGLYLLFSG
ncbi:MAG: hypothetical protein ACTHQ3_20985 [Motilibacteraceae bacterium]